MGAVARTDDGYNHKVTKQSIWQGQDKRQLASIPGSMPPIPYHSLLAETGNVLARYREIVFFSGERIYPEYIIAYRRT